MGKRARSADPPVVLARTPFKVSSAAPVLTALVLLTLLGLCACVGGGGTTTPTAGPTASPADGPPIVARGGRLPGGAGLELAATDGRFVAAEAAAPDARLVDLDGGYVVPAFVDSHVHLVYYPVSGALTTSGIAAAVDLAAPIDSVGDDRGPLRVIHAGPMLTAPMGYPTLSWGRDGYGLPCADAAACAAHVTDLHRRGAGVIKVAVTGERGLSDASLRGVVDRAHALGLRVAAHALSDDDARRAGAAGVDVLAHTPTEPLSDETVALFADRAVVSTLRAFGRSASAVDNLRRLREAGATVLYGTDLGNTRDTSIDVGELAALRDAGLSPAEIIDAATRVAAEHWGLDDLGELEPGRAASFLVVPRDPYEDPSVLADPSAVYLDGIRVR